MNCFSSYLVVSSQVCLDCTLCCVWHGVQWVLPNTAQLLGLHWVLHLCSACAVAQATVLTHCCQKCRSEGRKLWYTTTAGLWAGTIFLLHGCIGPWA